MTERTDLEQAGEAFRLLFVCTGNTCRSPMAEAIARRALADRGWTHVDVRSAGVAAFPGSPASGGARRVVERHGLPIEDHRATLLDREVVEAADLILTMTPRHLAAVEAAGGGDRAEVITAFGREEGGPAPGPEGIVDPVGGEDSLYEATYLQLEELIERVLDRLEPILAP